MTEFKIPTLEELNEAASMVREGSSFETGKFVEQSKLSNVLKGVGLVMEVLSKRGLIPGRNFDVLLKSVLTVGIYAGIRIGEMRSAEDKAPKN